jgi:hypothetical protein
MPKKKSKVKINLQLDPTRQSYVWMYPPQQDVGMPIVVEGQLKQITQEDVAIGVCYDNRRHRFLSVEEAKALKIKVATNQEKYDIYR